RAVRALRQCQAVGVPGPLGSRAVAHPLRNLFPRRRPAERAAQDPALPSETPHRARHFRRGRGPDDQQRLDPRPRALAARRPGARRARPAAPRRAPGHGPELFPSGVDAGALRERFDLPDNGTRWLVTVARLQQHKGMDTVIDALPAILERAPDVRYGETGLLVPPEEPAAIADAICRRLADPAAATRMGQNGRRAVETYFNWDRVVRDLRDIESQAVSGA